MLPCQSSLLFGMISCLLLSVHTGDTRIPCCKTKYSSEFFFFRALQRMSVSPNGVVLLAEQEIRIGRLAAGSAAPAPCTFVPAFVLAVAQPALLSCRSAPNPAIPCHLTAVLHPSHYISMLFTYRMHRPLPALPSRPTPSFLSSLFSSSVTTAQEREKLCESTRQSIASVPLMHCCLWLLLPTAQSRGCRLQSTTRWPHG